MLATDLGGAPAARAIALRQARLREGERARGEREASTVYADGCYRLPALVRSASPLRWDRGARV